MGVITRGWRTLGGAALVSLSVAASAQAATPIYQDPSHSFEERAADLVARMTPAEKASQTVSSVAPAIPRLGVAQFAWWNEALHGVARYGYKDNANPDVLRNTTSYPISQSLGASWDPSLMHRVASEIGDEARETAPDNRLNLDFYSPTINLERDPRWGRTDEAFSEDPFLTTAMGSQFVNGMEGKDEQGRLLDGANGYAKTLTTIKHYAANNSEVNRLNGSSDMDDRTLREYYTKAFRDVVRASHPGSVMSSYNRVNGVPSAADPYLNDTLLRQTFGFEGYLTSDCDAVFEITNGHKWQPANLNRPVNVPERHAYAMSAGEDLECQKGYADTYTNRNQLPSVIDQGIRTLNGTFNENDLDASLTRLFTARMRLGEFDDPAKVPWVTEARKRLPQGTWVNADTNNAVTQTQPRLQLAREAGAKSIVLLKNQGQALPLKVATGAPKVLVVGQFANPPKDKRYLGGYSADMGVPGQNNIVSPFEGIRDAIKAQNPNAVVDYQRGFTDPGITAADAKTIDPATVAAAANYDAVVVVGGTDGGTANEDGDRQNLTLPGAQGQLIDQLGKANPNTVAYLETIGPEDVSDFEGSVKAIVWSSYNGLRKGEALADVLLGTRNPSGRLPSTWYANVSQLPAITNYAIRPSGSTPGRTYQYFGGQPRYAFGYGLSYSTFAFSDAAVDRTAVTPDDVVQASVKVTNSSATAGRQTVQLYASTPGKALTTRPAKRLVGFRQVDLAAGQAKTVTIPVKVADLAFYDQTQRKWVVDTGVNRLQFAANAGDTSGANLDLTVSGAITPKPATVTAKPVTTGDAARGIQQRVQFAQGVDVLPQLTVAMNDDSLYGYRTRGDSRPLPAGVNVKYSTDDPDVVAAGPGGTLTTTGQGVATVTATVTANGASRSTRFVVRVVPQLTALEVGGKPLTATEPGTRFSADETDYDVLVPEGDAPAVTATAGDPAATVQVQQATSVPGTATVTSTGADGVAFTYRVRFTRPATGDEFDGDALDPKWSVVRGDAATAGVRDGAWVVTPETGDLNAGTNTAKNLLLQRAGGDWTIQSQLDFSAPPSADTQQAGLIAYESDDRYLKFGWESSGGVRRLNVTWEDDGGGTPLAQTLTTLPTASVLGDATTVWLRLAKTGPRYTAMYSTDGKDFRTLYETGASLRDVQVGAFAYDRAGTSPDLRVAFRYLRIENGTPATPPTAPPPAPAPGTPTTPAPGPSPSPGPAPSPSPSPAAPVSRPKVSRAALRADKAGRVPVKLRCGVSGAGRCRGELRLTQGSKVLAKRTFSVRADRSAKVTLRLGSKVRRRLAGARPARVRLRLRTRGSDGRTRTTTVRVTLRVPARR